MKSRFALGALIALIAAACGQAPTAPSVSPSGGVPGLMRSDADVSSPLEMRALAGRFTDALTGAAAGQFNLDTEAPDGRYRVTAAGAGVVPRQTTVTFPGTAPVISLIPSTFNMTGFDQMARQFGEPLGVTKRWTQAPALVIETALVEAQSVSGGVPQYPAVASAEQLSESSVNELVAQLSRALPLMTGGAFAGFASIERTTTAAGGSIEMDRPGTPSRSFAITA